MAGKQTTSSGKTTESAEVRMSAGAEAISLIEAIAAPCSVKDMANRVSRLVTRELQHVGKAMRPSRVEDIWRGEARRIDADELDALRRAAGLQKEAYNELATLRARIDRLEAALRLSDADFHQPQADALRELGRGPYRPLG